MGLYVLMSLAFAAGLAAGVLGTVVLAAYSAYKSNSDDYDYWNDTRP